QPLSTVQTLVGILAGMLTIVGAFFSMGSLTSAAMPPHQGEIVAAVQDARTRKPIAATVEILTPEDALVTTLNVEPDGSLTRRLIGHGRFRGGRGAGRALLLHLPRPRRAARRHRRDADGARSAVRSPRPRRARAQLAALDGHRLRGVGPRRVRVRRAWALADALAVGARGRRPRLENGRLVGAGTPG